MKTKSGLVTDLEAFIAAANGAIMEVVPKNKLDNCMFIRFRSGKLERCFCGSREWVRAFTAPVLGWRPTELPPLKVKENKQCAEKNLVS